MKAPDIYRIPAAVLFFLGIVDLVRGIMHTFALRWSGIHIAGFDPATTPSDQFFLLGVFGISNFLTGFVFILISLRAREIAPYVLFLVPATYLLGLIGIGFAQVHMEATFGGRYFMMVYLAICVVTFVVFLIQRLRQRR
ncbi:MAG: hypothetical protein AB7G47_17605 [Mycolicibacterium sp.]|uniref:hypothetical protein n=1 Tax=Mycolicibacterium sp. TaxID=2320850 RepID=UPI003D0BFAA5